jgi:hypothetical protein
MAEEEHRGVHHKVHHAVHHVVRRAHSKYMDWSKHPVWMLATLILIVLVVAMFALRPPTTAPATGGNAPQNISISKSDLSMRVQTYLNDNFFKNQGLSAEVVSVEEYGNDLLLANVAVKNGTETLQEPTPLLVTKSGDFIILASMQAALNTSQKVEVPTPEPTPTPQPIQKMAKPEVKMFVMAFCPYGQAAEGMMAPVAALFGDKVSIEPHFVIYDKAVYAGAEDTYCVQDVCSMHGVAELKEDMRQACILKYDNAKWWDYVSAVNANCSVNTIDNCWKTAANSTGVNQTRVESCVSSEGVTLMQDEKSTDAEFGVQGSEAIIVNGQTVSPVEYRFDADKMKNVICSGFTDAPAECSQTIGMAGSTEAPSGGCGG